MNIEEIYTQYARDVRRYAEGLCRDEQQAEDIVSDVFLGVARRLQEGAQIQDMKSYLYHSARHAKINQLRSQDYRRYVPMGDLDDVLPGDFSVERQLVVRETVRECLAALTRKQRAVIEMQFVHGFDNAYTAEQLGMSEGNVKTTRHHAIQALQRMFCRKNITPGNVFYIE